VNGKDVYVFLSKYYALKIYKGVEIQLHAFLKLALHRGEYSNTLQPEYSFGKASKCTEVRRLGGQDRLEFAGEERNHGRIPIFIDCDGHADEGIELGKLFQCRS
jgi:hypothetical protein